MLRRAQLLVLALIVVVVAATAGSANAVTQPQLLVAVNATGGLCPPSMCHWSARITTTTISAEGRRSRRITPCRAPGADGSDRANSAPRRCRSSPVSCPIAYDGQERNYRFRGKREIRSCTYDLRDAYERCSSPIG